MISKAKWFTYSCGVRFRARLNNNRIEYRTKFRDEWEDAGTVTQAKRYISGKSPYGTCDWADCDQPAGAHGGNSHANDSERTVMRRVLKSLGVL